MSTQALTTHVEVLSDQWSLLDHAQEWSDLSQVNDQATNTWISSFLYFGLWPLCLAALPRCFQWAQLHSMALRLSIDHLLQCLGVQNSNVALLHFNYAIVYKLGERTADGF